MAENSNELLTWVNELLKLDYTKIQQCGGGAAYALILESVHPGGIPVSQLRWNCTMEYDFVQNYKILQNAFKKFEIEKDIPVKELSKCHYNENFQFLKWIKKYWDTHYYGAPFNPIKCRLKAKPAKKSPKFVTKSQEPVIAEAEKPEQPLRRAVAFETPAKLKEPEEVMFYSNPKFQAAPAISTSIKLLPRNYQNQLRFIPESGQIRPRSEIFSTIPKQIKLFSREKEAELHRKKVSDLQLRLAREAKKKEEIESENLLYKSKIEEAKRVISYHNNQNYEEVFEQLNTILV